MHELHEQVNANEQLANAEAAAELEMAPEAVAPIEAAAEFEEASVQLQEAVASNTEAFVSVSASVGLDSSDAVEGAVLEIAHENAVEKTDDEQQPLARETPSRVECHVNVQRASEGTGSAAEVSRETLSSAANELLLHEAMETARAEPMPLVSEPSRLVGSRIESRQLHAQTPLDGVRHDTRAIQELACATQRTNTLETLQSPSVNEQHIAPEVRSETTELVESSQRVDTIADSQSTSTPATEATEFLIAEKLLDTSSVELLRELANPLHFAGFAPQRQPTRLSESQLIRAELLDRM